MGGVDEAQVPWWERVLVEASRGTRSRDSALTVAAEAAQRAPDDWNAAEPPRWPNVLDRVVAGVYDPGDPLMSRTVQQAVNLAASTVGPDAVRRIFPAGAPKPAASEPTRSEAKQNVRPTIPKEVQRAVWRRDQGRCVECDSKELLEFDHVIPLSKGGSNTERNLQLLCQRCNRQKGARI